ncbi:MAG: arginase family protein [Thermoanaerobaculia bacterium]
MQTLAVPFHVGDFVEGFHAPAGATLFRPELPALAPSQRMAALFGDLAGEVARAGTPLVYAGDCMAPLGVLAGLERRGLSPFVVWLDAHGDFNTWETTPSGYIGGMPVAMMAGRGEQTIVRAIGLRTVEPGRILIADARDVDPAEGVALDGSGIRIVGVEEIARALPADVPIYVHLDVDVVTPSEMPALRFPAAGGPSLSSVEKALRAIGGTGRAVCATVACTWNPLDPSAGAAAAATDRLVAALTGQRRRAASG